jgi:uncharacterized protein (DUF952 family)
MPHIYHITTKDEGKNNLVKLVLDTGKLNVPMKYEMAPSVNEEFPHIFGPINLDAVIEAINLPQRREGSKRHKGAP